MGIGHDTNFGIGISRITGGGGDLLLGGLVKGIGKDLDGVLFGLDLDHTASLLCIFFRDDSLGLRCCL
jgi:hypothetical protein